MGEVFAGRYELVDPIGRGGVGAVWRAWDHRRRRYVAAKVLLQRDAHSLLRFVREQALRIDHPHVLAPASWAADDDKVLFTMDLVAGGSLAHLVGDYGPLPPSFVCTLLDQLLSGLAAVHAEDVVHRDIKPANVLLEATGTGRPRLRLSDFGIAMRLGEPRLTETNLVVGTPGYLAPEQMMGAEPDFPADLFAVGLVALYLLEGAKPDAKALIQYFAEHGTPGAPKGIPEPLWQVVATLLQPDPVARFRTATGARKALAAAAELLPVPGPDDEQIEIFDQLGPLPPGFGPDGPLRRGGGTRQAGSEETPEGGRGGGPSEAPEGSRGRGPSEAPEGGRDGGPSEASRVGRDGALSEASRVGDGGMPPEASRVGDGGMPPEASRVGDAGTPPERSRVGDAGTPPERSRVGDAGTPPERSRVGDAGTPPERSRVGDAGTPPEASRAGGHGMPPEGSRMGSGGMPPEGPPAASRAIPPDAGDGQASVASRPGTGSVAAGVGATDVPSDPRHPAAPPPQSANMSDTGSFHLPPPQPTVTTRRSPAEPRQRPGTPQPQHPQHRQSPQHSQYPQQHSPYPQHPQHSQDPQNSQHSPQPPQPSFASHQPQAPLYPTSPPAQATPVMPQRADVSTASYTAQDPQVPPSAPPISRPPAGQHRRTGRRSTRRPGPPAKVVIPLLLLALICYTAGFWALTHI
ncbi:serine/threonine-protein kinase [Streptomyces sp. TRM70350]|uniref:serine/threonine-protein kinase n=1 Tax=Streptomyces sp. TRM70350 TaxID=2856165 RepID=UPI001C47DCCC|nr:serine/threonine-protein kinase [Streptomyces sp. TRM70350]MBV7698874.1 protein kinase [Streptomyces sp. TRM70350]